VNSRLLRFEVDLELGVAFRLHIVGHVTAVDADDYLQVARAGVARVDCKLNKHAQFSKFSTKKFIIFGHTHTTSSQRTPQSHIIGQCP
jgi:hypothetical protein